MRLISHRSAASIYLSLGLPCQYPDIAEEAWRDWYGLKGRYEVVDLCHVRRKKWKPGQGGISLTGMTSPSLWSWHFTVRKTWRHSLSKIWAVKTQDNKMHMWLFFGVLKVFYKYINMGQSSNMVTGKYYNWLYVHFSHNLGRKFRSHYTLIDSAKCTMSCHCVLKLLGCSTPISA